MFPYTTLILSILVIIGIIIYQVDTLRLENDKSKSRIITTPKIFKKVQSFLQDILYSIGIRVYKTARRIRRKIQGKK